MCLKESHSEDIQLLCIFTSLLLSSEIIHFCRTIPYVISYSDIMLLKSILIRCSLKEKLEFQAPHIFYHLE